MHTRSLAKFVQASGTWTQIGDHVNTISGNLGSDPVSSFLRYHLPVSQAFEVIECDIEIPFPQAANQPDCAVGLVSRWNGSPNNNNGAIVMWFSFATDGTGALTGTSFVRVDTYFGGSQTNVTFPLVLDQYYKVRLVKIGQQTAVFVDDQFILLNPSSGSVAGNFIGMWAFRAEANFKNFTSCSYKKVPPTLTL
ncbi:MAG: hypothetical protein AB7F19_01395 [Candidatus Babeliales bacterium]